MLREAAVELGGERWGQAEAALGRMSDAVAGDALLAIVAVRPTPEAVEALGWHPTEAAVVAVEALLGEPELHRAEIDALEAMRSPEAIEALARRSAAGDVLATRALARQRDSRALEPLLALVARSDPASARRGADGLRDLRDPASTDELLVAVGHADPDVAVCAAHALVSMASPRVPEALDRLSAVDDEQARRLATHWRASWAYRAER